MLKITQRGLDRAKHYTDALVADLIQANTATIFTVALYGGLEVPQTPCASLLWLNQCLAGYITALEWADSPEDADPGAELQKSDHDKCALAVLEFVINVETRSRFRPHPPVDVSQFDASQVGHDLWLTRQGHGTGFWDRDESVYPKEIATLFSDVARDMKSVDIFVSDTDNSKLIIG